MRKDSGFSVFKYRFNGEEYFPIIPLLITFSNIKIRLDALVDSGATISIFREDVANQLGLNIETGKKIYLGGVGGRIRGYLHKLPIEIAHKEFLCPIVFSREYLVSFNLLGRQEFFKRFRIIFEEKKNFLKLE